MKGFPVPSQQQSPDPSVRIQHDATSILTELSHNFEEYEIFTQTDGESYEKLEIPDDQTVYSEPTFLEKGYPPIPAEKKKSLGGVGLENLEEPLIDLREGELPEVFRGAGDTDVYPEKTQGYPTRIDSRGQKIAIRFSVPSFGDAPT